MLLAEIQPYVNPEITLSGLGIIVSILGCSFGGMWWFTRQFTAVQTTFVELKGAIKSVQEQAVASDRRQEARFDKVERELEKQTQILQDQRVQAERLDQQRQRIEKLETRDSENSRRLDTVLEEIGRLRVGSNLSSQRQIGQPEATKSY